LINTQLRTLIASVIRYLGFSSLIFAPGGESPSAYQTAPAEREGNQSDYNLGMPGLPTGPWPPPVNAWAFDVVTYQLNDQTPLLFELLSPVKGIGKAPKLIKTAKRMFRGDLGISHFQKHAGQIMEVLKTNAYNYKNYIDDANYIINNGTFLPGKNAFYMFIGHSPKGRAMFGYVGLNRQTGHITTFHIKGVTELNKMNPGIGLIPY
jgi:hypothetical protein